MKSQRSTKLRTLSLTDEADNLLNKLSEESGLNRSKFINSMILRQSHNISISNSESPVTSCSDPTIRTTISLKQSEHDMLMKISKDSNFSLSFLLVSSALGIDRVTRKLRDKFRITINNTGWDRLIECCALFISNSPGNEITIIMKRVGGLYDVDGNSDDVNHVLKFIDDLKSRGAKIESFILP